MLWFVWLHSIDERRYYATKQTTTCDVTPSHNGGWPHISTSQGYTRSSFGLDLDTYLSQVHTQGMQVWVCAGLVQVQQEMYKTTPICVFFKNSWYLVEAILVGSPWYKGKPSLQCSSECPDQFSIILEVIPLMISLKNSKNTRKNGISVRFPPKEIQAHTRRGTEVILTLDSYPWPMVPVLLTPGGWVYSWPALPHISKNMILSLFIHTSMPLIWAVLMLYIICGELQALIHNPALLRMSLPTLSHQHTTTP